MYISLFDSVPNQLFLVSLLSYPEISSKSINLLSCVTNRQIDEPKLTKNIIMSLHQ